MSYHHKILVYTCMAIALFQKLTISQDKGENFSTIGLDAGYFLPYGEWNQHRYAQGIDQFGGGYYISGVFSYRFQPRLGALAYAFYSPIDVSDWEKYAQKQGDTITASAYATGMLLGMQIYLLEQKPNLLSLDLNWGWIYLSGKETFEEFSYHYDFLQSSLAVSLGIVYSVLLSENFAFALTARGFYVFKGINYSDGESFDVIMLPVTAGIRYVF
jgi:hypothetical protein